jgi:RHS repeat-associated protein
MVVSVVLASSVVVAAGCSAAPAPAVAKGAAGANAAGPNGGPAPLPSGPVVSPGAVGSASVNPALGSLTTSIPISVPAFRGQQPDIVLSYDSGGGNGWLGVGWALRGVSYISRQSALRGAPSWGPSDLFALDGMDLVPCGLSQGSISSFAPACRLPAPPPGGSYYTTRDERDMVIERRVDPVTGAESWTVTEPSGTVQAYLPDETPASRNGAVLRFHLASIRDLLGNTVNYDYTLPGPNSVPALAAISYNGTVIRFYSKSRPDTVSFATGGDVMQLSSRLKSIVVSVSGRLLRAYQLSYDDAGGAKRSALAQVTEFGNTARVDASGNVSGTSLPSQSFTTNPALYQPWTTTQNPPQTVPAAPTYAIPGPVEEFPTTMSPNWQGDLRTGAFDGSGRSGVAMRTKPSYGSCSSSLDEITLHGKGEKFSTLTMPAGYCLTTLQWWAADVNGDGRDDLVFLQASDVDTPRYTSFEIVSFLNRGDGTFVPGPSRSLILGGYWRYRPQPGISSTFNGNQLVVGALLCGMGDVTGASLSSLVCLAAGTPFAPVYVLTFAWGAAGVSETDRVPGFGRFVPTWVLPPDARDLAFQLADVDGDGRADIVKYIGDGTNRVVGLQVALSGGGGNWGTPVFSPTPAMTDVVTAAGADLTGSGRADFVAMAGGSVVTMLSNGDGTFADPQSESVPTYTADNTTYHVVPGFEAGDVDGSGRAGLMFYLHRYAHARDACSAGNLASSYVLRVVSNGDGSFSWPSSLQDCAHVQEFKVGPVLDYWTNSYVGAAPIPGAASTLGDGLADFVALDSPLFGYETTRPVLWVVHAAQQTVAPASWAPADLGPSGLPGFASIEPGGRAPVVRTLTPSSCDPRCRNYSFAQQPLQPQVPVPGGPPRPVPATVRADWHLVDNLGTGRTSLVYVDSSQTYFPPSPPFVATPATLVLTFLPAASGGWNPTPVVTWLPLTVTTKVQGWSEAPVTGDGKAGLVTVALVNGVFTVLSLLPQADGHWTEAPSHPFGLTRAGLFDLHWRVADVNGDHRADLIHIAPAQTYKGCDVPCTEVVTLLGDGLGHFRSAISHLSVPGGGSDVDQADWLLGDINGDGMTDIVWAGGGSDPLPVDAILSNGDGAYRPLAPVRIPIPDKSPNKRVDPLFTHGQWALFDVNGDGGADLVNMVPAAPQPGQSSLSITGAYATFTATGFSQSRTQQFSAVTYTLPIPGTYAWSPVDVNLDGSIPLTQIVPTPAGFTIYEFANAPSDGRITSIGNGIGGSATIRYAPASQWASPGCGMPSGVALTVVSSIATALTPSHSDSGYAPETFAYKCPHWSAEFDQMLGWNTLTTTFRGSRSTSPLTTTETRTLSESCGLQTTSQDTYNPANNNALYTSAVTTWYSQGRALSADCRRATVINAVCNQLPFCSKSIDQYSYDPFGNTTGVTEGEFADRRTVESRYDSSLQPYVVDLLADQKLTNPAGATISETRYCYDGDTSTACDTLKPSPKGLLTTVRPIDATHPQGQHVTRYTYDGYGNVTSITDQLGHRTTLAYDTTYHLYLVTVTNALHQTSTEAWVPGLDVPQLVVDANKLKTAYQYDQYGRPTAVIAPTGLRTTTSYNNLGNPSAQDITTTNPDGTWATIRFDGLGRPYLQAHPASVANMADITVTTYADASDRVYQQQYWRDIPLPLPATIPAALTVPSETYSYDGLSRLTRERHSDGTAITTSFQCCAAGLTTTYTTDEAGHTQETLTDAWGRAVGAWQGNSITRYRFDDSDQLTGITDPNSNRTTFTYDAFGQLVSETDPNRGTWTYTYDPVGNLATSTDSREQTTRYHYDALNRLTERDDPGAAVPTGWHFDQAAHGPSIGQLTSITGPSAEGCTLPPALGEATPNVEVSIRYDSAGRQAGAWRCVGGRHVAPRAESTGVVYDNVGRVKDTIYPDGQAVPSSYDPAGRLSAEGSYVTSAAYDAGGRLESVTFGDGTTQQLTYNAGRGWLSSINLSNAAATTLYNQTLSYNANSTVASETSTANGNNRAYTYDALGRLSTVTGDTTQTLQYDAAGNITSDSQLGTYTYPASGCASTTCGGPDAVTAITPPPGAATPAQTLKYDPNGNLTAITQTGSTAPTTALTWNGANQPSRLTTRTPGPYQTVTANLTLTYDAEGNLVRQADTANSRRHRHTDTRTYGPLAQWQAGTGLIKNYLFDGAIVARTDNTGTHYLHNDRLGSPVLTTNSSGAITNITRYSAWGQPANTATPLNNAPAYAGAQSLNAASPIIQLGARLYDTSTGRFLSPDSYPIAGHTSQSTNRYSYTENDPINYTDPTGHLRARTLSCCAVYGQDGGDWGVASPGYTQQADPTAVANTVPWAVGGDTTIEPSASSCGACVGGAVASMGIPPLTLDPTLNADLQPTESASIGAQTPSDQTQGTAPDQTTGGPNGSQADPGQTSSIRDYWMVDQGGNRVPASDVEIVAEAIDWRVWPWSDYYSPDLVSDYISTFWNGKQESLSNAYRNIVQTRQQPTNYYNYNLAIAGDYLRARLETMKWGSTIAEEEVMIYMGLKDLGLIPSLGPGPVSPYTDAELTWMLKGVSDQEASQHWYNPLATEFNRIADFVSRHLPW